GAGRPGDLADPPLRAHAHCVATAGGWHLRRKRQQRRNGATRRAARRGDRLRRPLRIAVALIIPRDVAEQLLDPRSAMDALRPVMIEEAAGTTLHMPPFGGSKSARPTFRLVGGGLYGMQRMGVRAGATQLFDTETGRLLAIVGGATGWRVAATMGLAAQYLAQPDAARVGLLGSGRNALPILQCLALVRHIERVDAYSPTQAPRERLAEQA